MPVIGGDSYLVKPFGALEWHNAVRRDFAAAPATAPTFAFTETVSTALPGAAQPAKLNERLYQGRAAGAGHSSMIMSLATISLWERVWPSRSCRYYV